MEVLALLTLNCLDSVTKTNLSVNEDKNRVPFVKVRPGLGQAGGARVLRARAQKEGISRPRSWRADSLDWGGVWGLDKGTALKGHLVTVQVI